MTTSEIIAVIASICAAISAFAAVFSTVLHYKQSKPKIWINIKQRPGDCCYIYNPISPTEIEHFAILSVSFANFSSVNGVVASGYIMYHGIRYDVENMGSLYEPKTIHYLPGSKSGFAQDANKFRLQMPVCIPPYSAVWGFFYFPKFPSLSSDVEDLEVYFETIDRKIIKRKFIVHFEDATNNYLLVTKHPL